MGKGEQHITLQTSHRRTAYYSETRAVSASDLTNMFPDAKACRTV